MLNLVPFRDWSIRHKLIGLFIAMAVVTATAISIPMSLFDFLSLRRGTAADVTMLTDVLARNSTAALSFGDAKAAREVLQAVQAQTSVTAACIYTSAGDPLAKYLREGNSSTWTPPAVRQPGTVFEKDRLIVSRAIVLGDDEIGTIYVESDLRALNRRLREYLVTVLITFVGALGLAYFLASRLQRPISLPLGALVETAGAISRARDYSIRAAFSRRDEFGTLVNAFNSMLDQIEARDHELQQHREQLEETVAVRTRELVTANNQLRQAEEKYRTIFEDAVIGIFQIAPDGKPLSANRALAQMHGYDSAEEFLTSVTNMADELFVNSARMHDLRVTLEENGIVRDIELELYRKDRSKKWALANLRAVRDGEGKTSLIEGTLQDISDRKEAEGRVQFLAFYDELTGLPNRTLLRDRLEKAMASAERRKEKLALLFLDLDRFKIINDSLGHSVGDQLLKDVADRLKQWARAQDTVARIGGDEFLVVITQISDAPAVAVVAERLMDAMTAHFSLQGRKFNVNCSIGISMFPDHGVDSETLIKNADAAMYCAKESGRNAFRFFTDEMNAEVVERLTLEHNLRSAVERQQLFLLYQPQIEIATGMVVGVEALLRWRHPELGLVPTDQCIRVAESCGLILPIGEWVLRTACAAAREWKRQGISTTVAVNVSAVQFRHVGFVEMVAKVVEETGLGPESLELELTESLLLGNADLMLPVLQDLKRMGVRLAIDDFGTGYSSLSYLRHYPVYKLKIDRSFIKSVAFNPDDAAITAAIIGMGQSLNVKVIAEGVENEAQMAFLRTHKCDEIQGYYFSEPLTAGEIPEALRNAAGLRPQAAAQAAGTNSSS